MNKSEIRKQIKSAKASRDAAVNAMQYMGNAAYQTSFTTDRYSAEIDRLECRLKNASS